MTKQPLIPPYVPSIEYRCLIDEYLRRVPNTTSEVRPITAINPSNYEVIQINSDSQTDHIYQYV